jgi:hypothetical protein
MQAEHQIALRYFALLAVFVAAIVAFTLYAIEMPNHLQRPQFLTGYLMFGLMIAVALLNFRKKLSMVPVGRAAYWLALHVFFGVLIIGLYFIHTQTIWPHGGFEQAFALLVYLVTASGLVGYALQRIIPRRLATSGIEIIYERIPAELSEIRHEVQEIVLACTKESGADTLSRHYLETLSWYFRKPRFFAGHLLGLDSGEHWVHFQVQPIGRYLNDAERAHLAKIEALALYKNRIDMHFAGQSVLKYWLLAHVPLAAALVAMMFWHVIIVNVYAL